MSNIKKIFRKELGREDLLRVVLSYMEQIGRQQNSDNMEELLKAMLREVFTSKWVQLWWYDPNEHRLVSRNLDAPESDISVSIENGLLSKAYRTGEAFFSNQIQHGDELFIESVDNIRGYEIGKSMLLLPVKDNNEVILAIFQMMTHVNELNQFTEKDLELYLAIEQFAVRMVKLIELQSSLTQSTPEPTEQGRDEASLLLEKEKFKSEIINVMSHFIGTSLPEEIELVRSRINSPKAWERLHDRLDYFKIFMKLQQDLCSPKCGEGVLFTAHEKVFNPIRFFERFDLFFEDIAPENRLKTCLFVDPNLPIGLVSDPVRLGEALSILLFNAYKCAPEGTTVNCDILFENNKLKLCIVDSGNHMTNDEVELLTTPEMSSASRSLRSNGMPIAIYACESIGAEITYQLDEEKNKFCISLESDVADSSVFYDVKAIANAKVVILHEDKALVSRLLRYLDAFGLTSESYELIDNIAALDLDKTTHLLVAPNVLDDDSLAMLKYDNIVTILLSDNLSDEASYRLNPVIPVREFYEMLCVNLLSRRILLLDSTDELTDFFNEVINGTDITLEQVADSRKFVGKFQELTDTINAYDLVITTENDAKGMVPRNAIRAIRTYEQNTNLNATPKIAILGSMATEADSDRYYASGADEVHLKPIGKKLIRKVLKTHLKTNQL